MGTRSLTVMHEENGDEIVVMYRQMDGYPTGHGQELADFLKTFVAITNGITTEEHRTANGPDCLAAQIIAHFKDGVGGIYLHPAGSRDMWEDYIYHVFASTGKPIVIRVESPRREGQNQLFPLFEGPVHEYDGKKIESL